MKKKLLNTLSVLVTASMILSTSCKRTQTPFDMLASVTKNEVYVVATPNNRNSVMRKTAMYEESAQNNWKCPRLVSRERAMYTYELERYRSSGCIEVKLGTVDQRRLGQSTIKRLAIGFQEGDTYVNLVTSQQSTDGNRDLLFGAFYVEQSFFGRLFNNKTEVFYPGKDDWLIDAYDFEEKNEWYWNQIEKLTPGLRIETRW